MEINEIIGRALLEINDDDDGMKVAYQRHPDMITLDGHWEYAEIGTAVVRALAEAGYEVIKVIRDPDSDPATKVE